MKFIQHPLAATIILFSLGAGSVLGFAPFYLFPVSILAVAGLCLYWMRATTAWQAARIGFLFGLGMYVVGIYWIYISLHDFGQMPALFAALCTFLLCAFMALFPALVGAISIRIAPSTLIRMLIAVPALWALSDWTRSWIFTGFPWLTMGYSQVPHSPLAGFIPVIGVYGVSLLVILSASLIACWIMKNRLSTTPKRHYLLIALAILWMSGLGLKLVDWTQQTGAPLKVALLQGNISQDLKWAPEVAEQTIQRYVTMAEASDAKLIVMPETAMPLLSNDLPEWVTTRLQQHAIKNQGDILIGLVENENGEYFNSMLSLGSAASATYRKSHLVPFGEYIPLKQVFGWIYRDLLNMPLSDMSRGSIHQQPMNIADQQVAINICYEDVFGEEIIRQLPQASLLVNVSNDAWYGKSYAAAQHMQFSQARALETGRMMLRATNTGATAAIDPQGYVFAHAPHFTETTVNVIAQGYTGSTPYVLFGNWLFLLLSFAGLLFAWRRKPMIKD
ncbi:MAG: apolipoprotein N-acyltransferase [Methylotenera sp.]|nr:MAG: apolipoprotein N-acyltransferase [Methylotenera sp.]